MVESAPLFIEYCCEGYMNITAVNAIVFLAVVYPLIASTFSFLTQLALDIRARRKSRIEK